VGRDARALPRGVFASAIACPAVRTETPGDVVVVIALLTGSGYLTELAGGRGDLVAEVAGSLRGGYGR
jgi:hypothetical protein